MTTYDQSQRRTLFPSATVATIFRAVLLLILVPLFIWVNATHFTVLLVQLLNQSKGLPNHVELNAVRFGVDLFLTNAFVVLFYFLQKESVIIHFDQLIANFLNKIFK